MESPSTDIVNCFPSLSCLHGDIPDECKNGHVVCPTLPRTPSDSNVYFPKNSGVASTAVSSDSESDTKHNNTQNQNQTNTLPTNPQRPSRPHRRIPHTIIERRYRDNLNTQIETLRLTLPSLKNAYVCSPDVEDSALPPRLPSKAMIIATAATYIKDLENERNQAVEEARMLQQQVVDLQKLIQCNDCSILQYLQAVGGNQQQGQMEGQQQQMGGQQGISV